MIDLRRFGALPIVPDRDPCSAPVGTLGADQLTGSLQDIVDRLRESLGLKRLLQRRIFAKFIRQTGEARQTPDVSLPSAHGCFPPMIDL
jgi:hypothetical protein